MPHAEQTRNRWSLSGSGKTQTARKLAEAMMDLNQRIGIIDPTGAWWGLRSSADGLSPGHPIVVGGGGGEVPLRPDAGAALAFLRHANLQKAFLRQAVLQKADVEKANLQNAILGEANLKDAKLGGAFPQQGVRLTIEQIKSA